MFFSTNAGIERQLSGVGAPSILALGQPTFLGQYAQPSFDGKQESHYHEIEGQKAIFDAEISQMRLSHETEVAELIADATEEKERLQERLADTKKSLIAAQQTSEGLAKHIEYLEEKVTGQSETERFLTYKVLLLASSLREVCTTNETGETILKAEIAKVTLERDELRQKLDNIETDPTITSSSSEYGGGIKSRQKCSECKLQKKMKNLVLDFQLCRDSKYEAKINALEAQLVEVTGEASKRKTQLKHLAEKVVDISGIATVAFGEEHKEDLVKSVLCALSFDSGDMNDPGLTQADVLVTSSPGPDENDSRPKCENESIVCESEIPQEKTNAMPQVMSLPFDSGDMNDPGLPQADVLVTSSPGPDENDSRPKCENESIVCESEIPQEKTNVMPQAMSLSFDSGDMNDSGLPQANVLVTSSPGPDENGSQPKCENQSFGCESEIQQEKSKVMPQGVTTRKTENNYASANNSCVGYQSDATGKTSYGITDLSSLGSCTSSSLDEPQSVRIGPGDYLSRTGFAHGDFASEDDYTVASEGSSVSESDFSMSSWASSLSGSGATCSIRVVSDGIAAQANLSKTPLTVAQSAPTKAVAMGTSSIHRSGPTSCSSVKERRTQAPKPGMNTTDGVDERIQHPDSSYSHGKSSNSQLVHQKLDGLNRASPDETSPVPDMAPKEKLILFAEASSAEGNLASPSSSSPEESHNPTIVTDCGDTTAREQNIDENSKIVSQESAGLDRANPDGTKYPTNAPSKETEATWNSIDVSDLCSSSVSSTDDLFPNKTGVSDCQDAEDDQNYKMPPQESADMNSTNSDETSPATKMPPQNNQVLPSKTASTGTSDVPDLVSSLSSRTEETCSETVVSDFQASPTDNENIAPKTPTSIAAGKQRGSKDTKRSQGEVRSVTRSRSHILQRTEEWVDRRRRLQKRTNSPQF